jgi:hypothetical protein
MFAALEISIDNGSGAQAYTATGAYLYLGYVSVIWASNLSRGQLQGTTGTVYWCSSGRSIGQGPIHVGDVRMGHLYRRDLAVALIVAT